MAIVEAKMEMKIPRKFKDILDQNSALSGLVNTSINEFGEWLKQNNVKLFSEYTDHSLEHVENVLATAHDLIRDECKAFITPHDVATLILATLLHDSAMHISEDGFANLVKEDSNSTINGFEDKPWNRLWTDFLAESRRFSGRKLTALFGDAEPVRHPPLDDLQQLNGKDLLLCGEFLRRHHSRLAHEIALFGVPGYSGRILKLPTTEDTSHVVDLAGLIARSHGLSLRDCFEYLQTHYSSIKMVRGVHPTFLMALLRIADFLQIQSSRAPKQVQKIRQMKSPVSSGEWEMHQAIKDISTKEYPETIWIVAKPENVKTYLRIRNMLDQIQAELDLSWTVIGEVYGYDPEFREFGLKIRRIRSNIDEIDSFSKHISYIPVHASFEVADTDLLKLLIGPLYGEKAEIGIRELMQNAIDAVNELHEYKKQLKYTELDIPDKEGDIVISIDQKEDGEWWLTISDRGIGMTISTVKEYFLKAGASLRRSEIWKKTFEDADGKSKILRSGRFGIGVLAAYLVGDEIKVTTRHVSCLNDSGIEFTAQLDTEAIEIKHVNRPVGTTILIKMKKESIEALIPSADDSKWVLKRKGLKWDWYCFDNPLIVRKINQASIKQNQSMPQLNSELPFGWRRIKHPDFEDIHWSYLPYLPDIVCNGIQVRAREEQGRSGSARIDDKYIGFERPSLSIFDFNAHFPINIQRTAITTRTLPFQDELLKDVIRDFIAFTLVEAPTNNPLTDVENRQHYTTEYHSRVSNSAERYYSAIAIPCWVSTTSGTGMFCDPTLFNRLGHKPVLVVFNYENEPFTPKVNLPKDEFVLQILVANNVGNTLINLNDVIAAGLGFSLRDMTNIDFYAIPLRNYGNILSAARVLISKKIIQALDSFREYSQLEHDFLQDLTNITLPVFDDDVSFEDFNSKKLEKAFRINREWEDENWVLLEAGECPSSKFDFEEFAKTCADSDLTKWPCILAEWYFNENAEQKEESVFVQTWDELIQTSVIPYDLAERKKVLSNAYRKLESDTDNYIATKKLIEKERKKMRDED